MTKGISTEHDVFLFRSIGMVHSFNRYSIEVHFFCVDT